MPRGNRFMLPGMICHLTHRCHNGAFLFRFARDRSEYRERLRDASRQFKVSLLNFSFTCNHTHKIAIESGEGGISRMMHKAEGGYAASFNRRHDRSGSFYEDRYHCTMVEDGEHLWNCITYVDLNMVRAGVVPHPENWEWCGYQELVGKKTRNRLVDLERVLELLGLPDLKTFAEEYRFRIERAIAGQRLTREKRWTESIAVGSQSFVETISAHIRRERLRPKIEVEEDGSWSIREPSVPYCRSRFNRR